MTVAYGGQKTRGEDQGVHLADQTTGHRTAPGGRHPLDASGTARGDRPRSRPADARRRMDGGRRSECLQHDRRLRHRPDDASYPPASAGEAHRHQGAGDGIRLGADGRQRPVALAAVRFLARCSVHPDHHRLLHLRLHEVAEAPDLAERHLGRRGRLHAGRPPRTPPVARSTRAGIPGRRPWSCSSSSSSGRRPTPGRSVCVTARTTRPPVCR